ncbi:MAG: DUF4157 domain-containing protein [Moorea sp. SIOASIH]|uniref:eCIS core domain-containing protein n=1 Tax=Moorena sp. SIOASIH TaxID=2607817 RepID=UPI0013B82304|nr:DUF4157 domain-containing protein [Moorena sp. SIOASIH]NEO41063.1 DUF4157 domain-containing protein [Moorena sp. SIOASIH]
MYRQQVAKKTFATHKSKPISKDITPKPSYGSLSSVVQRAQQDPKLVSEDEWQLLDSAIGTRATRDLAGKQTPWEPQFKGISAQFWGDSRQQVAPIQAKGKEDVRASQVQPDNQTGLPDKLKAGIENLSGMAIDDVRVHYNSPKPAQLQALAYTQGTNIHVAPGQERYLPHEAWHVVQQKEGRVKPRTQLKGVSINADPMLEREADIMGAQALNFSVSTETPLETPVSSVNQPIQLISNEQTAMEAWARENLPHIKPIDEMDDFRSVSNVANQLVDAVNTIKDKSLSKTAAHTITMFQYMYENAASIGQRIGNDFTTLTDAAERNNYLIGLASVLNSEDKINRGLWIGSDDREMIAVDVLKPVTYFQKGRNDLITKAQETLDAGRTLEALLEDHSYNMDAKSYGRRVEALEEIDVNELKLTVEEVNLPQVGQVYPHDQPGYVYYDDGYNAVQSQDLVQNQEYVLYIHNTKVFTVNVETNTGAGVKFSSVEQ